MLVGAVAIRVRDVIRQVAIKHELTKISGKIARDHVHVLVAYRPHQDVSTVVQWFKGISSRVLLQEFEHLRRQCWGLHLWARGYLAVSSGNVTAEMVRRYIEELEGEAVKTESRFQIDSH
jgi:putative transposase